MEAAQPDTVAAERQDMGEPEDLSVVVKTKRKQKKKKQRELDPDLIGDVMVIPSELVAPPAQIEATTQEPQKDRISTTGRPRKKKKAPSA